jgi:hypothetical protein
MMRMKKKVSVIIPTLGRSTLYPLIERILKQRPKASSLFPSSSLSSIFDIFPLF